MRNPMTPLIESLLTGTRDMSVAADLTGPSPVRTGPGRRTLDNYYPPRRSRYSGADLRRLRAERGVGRPPHKRGR